VTFAEGVGMLQKCWQWTLIFALAWVSSVALAEPPPPDDLLAEADEYKDSEGVTDMEALALYAKACEAGLAEACGEQAEILFWGLGDVTADKAKAGQVMKGALSGLDAACTAGSARACLRLGFAYADAVGTAQDYPKAAALDEKACDGGLGEACMFLGHAYAKGKGVTLNPARAHMLYVKACQLGHAPACKLSPVKPLDTPSDAKSPEGPPGI